MTLQLRSFWRSGVILAFREKRPRLIVLTVKYRTCWIH